MEFKDIMAISGKPGLYKFVAQGRNSVIVENLETGKRISAFTTERVSSFEEISVFTEDADVPLADVFKNMFEKLDGKEALSPKSGADELKNFFSEVLPDYDPERVYVSDIKKVISWYNTLQKLQLLKDLLETREKEATSETSGQEKTKSVKSGKTAGEEETEEKTP